MTVIATAVGAVVVSIGAGLILAGLYSVVKERDRKRRAWNDHLFGSK